MCLEVKFTKHVSLLPSAVVLQQHQLAKVVFAVFGKTIQRVHCPLLCVVYLQGQIEMPHIRMRTTASNVVLARKSQAEDRSVKQILSVTKRKMY